MQRLIAGLLVLFGTMGLGIFLGNVASEGAGMAGLGVAFLHAFLLPLFYFVLILFMYRTGDKKSNNYLFVLIGFLIIASSLWALFGK